MNIQRFATRIAIALVLLIAGTGLASAQATRTWVSGVGDDVNPCSRTAPCKTFAGAISKTAAGGIINVLDPGGFGTVTITKSITLEADGDLGSILASATNGIIINITDTVANPDPTVVLRGLTIDGAGAGGPTGLNGIRFLAGAKLVVDRCSIQNFTQTGITMAPSAGTARLVVNNTAMNRNQGSAILISPTGTGQVTAALTDVRMTNGGFGLQVTKGIVSLQKSVVSGNSSAGIKAQGPTAPDVSRIAVDDSLISDNTGIGINAQGAQAAIFVSNSTITNNAQGLSGLLSGKITSFSNNRLFGNTTDGSPTGNQAEQ